MKSMDSNRIFELRRTINEFEDKKVPKKQIMKPLKLEILRLVTALPFHGDSKALNEK